MVLKIHHPLIRYAANPAIVLGVILAVSAISLIGALIAEHVYGLKPCILCIYQRIPFVIAIGLSVAGLMLTRSGVWGRTLPTALCIPTFGVNAGIATHHVGVEQKWWSSFAEGCAVEGISSVRGDDLLKQIMEAPAVRCDEIPWADPIFGVSMAGYNALLCAGMTVFCALCAYLIYRGSRPQLDITA